MTPNVATSILPAPEMLVEEFQFEPEPTGGEREEEGIRDARPVDDGRDRGPPEATRPRKER